MDIKVSLPPKEGDEVLVYGISDDPPVLWRRTPRFVVLKWPGQHYWSARGERGYAKARFAVYDRWHKQDDTDLLHELVSFTVSKPGDRI